MLESKFAYCRLSQKDEEGRFLFILPIKKAIKASYYL